MCPPRTRTCSIGISDVGAAGSRMASTARTDIAFAKYRNAYQPDQLMNPEARRYDGDADQMSPEDGLMRWVDGPVEDPGPEPEERPELAEKPDGLRLWVVTREHILHALETYNFGAKREAGPPSIAI